MKKFQKTLVGICIASMLVGCGSSANKSEMAATESAYDADMYNGYAADGVYEQAAEEAYEEEAVYEEPAEAGGKADKVQETAQSSQRKLIKRVNMDVETDNFDELRVSIERKVDTLGGYIENSSMFESGYGTSAYRNMNFKIRIPKDKLDTFVGEIEKGSNVRSKDESVDDVTLSYVDLKSRKEAYEARKKRLMKFMDEAETMEEMLTIDKELTEVLYQIESMESQLRTYDNQVDYSTVDLNVKEVTRIEPVAEESMWSQMTVGFMESVYDVGMGLRNFAIWFVSNLPIIIIWIVIIFVIVKIIKLIHKKNKEKKETKKEAKRKLQERRASQNAVTADEKADTEAAGEETTKEKLEDK